MAVKHLLLVYEEPCPCSESCFSSIPVNVVSTKWPGCVLCVIQHRCCGFVYCLHLFMNCIMVEATEKGDNWRNWKNMYWYINRGISDFDRGVCVEMLHYSV